MEVKIYFYVLFICLAYATANPIDEFIPKIRFNKRELKKKLTGPEYLVTQEGYGELPDRGKYVNHQESGTYRCVVCEEEKFKSENKVRSLGWPTFDKANGVAEIPTNNKFKGDFSAALCENCGSIMGEVRFQYPDGRKEKSWWINSATLQFVPEGQDSPEPPKKKKTFKSYFGF